MPRKSVTGTGPVFSVDPMELVIPNESPNGNGANSTSIACTTSAQNLLLRHLNEDLNAYQYDLEYCRQQLREERGLTPQEARALRLRVFDLSHQIRHCKHRVELISFEARTGIKPSDGFSSAQPTMSFSPINGSTSPLGIAPPSSTLLERMPQNGSPSLSVSVPTKRPRKSTTSTPAESAKRPKNDSTDADGLKDEQQDGNAVQRLGFWKCRLCVSERYLGAGAGRLPSGPCKWPLRDISKLIAHFTEMHGEHTPAERCQELGDALDQNRGPLEYWFRRTHSFDLGDGSVIGECVSSLQGGRLPAVLRQLSRAASNFPEEEE